MSDTQFTFLGQPGSCSDWTQGIPIARNTTSSRVCGISYTSNNDTFLLRPCCSSDVEIYACASYCASNMSISDFAGCVLNARGNSTTAPLDGDNIFCQGNITPSEKQSLAATSSAMPATRAPRFSVWLAVLLGFMLFSPSLASVIPPLDDLAGSVARRATSCDFTIDSKYSKLGATIGPLSGYSSGSRVEATGNNRTVNGSSAASAEYDGFFGVLANLTGRRYPAVTGVSLDFEWYNSGDAATYLAFTPYLVSCY